MRRPPSTVVSVVLGALVAVGCGESIQEVAPSEAPPTPPAAVDGRPAREPAVPPTSFGCIRGGTSRAEVLQLMGEPDSVSYGIWFYGTSEISFGYGVVLDYSEAGRSLPLCSDARTTGGASDARAPGTG